MFLSKTILMDPSLFSIIVEPLVVMFISSKINTALLVVKESILAVYFWVLVTPFESELIFRLVAAVDTEMEKLADAEDKLKTLNSNFKSSSTNPQVLSEQKELDL